MNNITLKIKLPRITTNIYLFKRISLKVVLCGLIICLITWDIQEVSTFLWVKFFNHFESFSKNDSRYMHYIKLYSFLFCFNGFDSWLGNSDPTCHGVWQQQQKTLNLPQTCSFISLLPSVISDPNPDCHLCWMKGKQKPERFSDIHLVKSHPWSQSRLCTQLCPQGKYIPSIDLRL